MKIVGMILTEKQNINSCTKNLSEHGML